MLYTERELWTKKLRMRNENTKQREGDSPMSHECVKQWRRPRGEW